MGTETEAAEPAEPITVLVVDDHDLFRSGLSAMLKSAPGIEVIGQASRATLGIRLALELRPQVVLMDLRLPDIDGLDAIGQIVEQSPDARVIVLTVASDEADVAAAVLAGACGYLLKDNPIESVVAAVRAAAAGESWLSPKAASAVLDKIRRDHVEPLGKSNAAGILSPRELEILRLLARGLENAEIAAELHISPRTAKNHLSNVLAKLGMSNRVQAAIYAVRHGLD